MQALIARIVRFARDLSTDQRGQMAPILLSAVMVGYSAFLGASFDMGNLWLHKMRVTRAANAACVAGAGDILWAANQTNASTITGYKSTAAGFDVTGSGGACGADSNVVMCYYAMKNGYNPSTSGVKVSWTLSNVPPNGATPVNLTNGVHPFMSVAVTEQVKTYLLSLVPGMGSVVTVTGHCNCGITGQPGPELSLTGACPSSEFAYDTNAWQSVTRGQIRTTGNNFDYGESQYYVSFNCNDNWIDQDGNSHPWNYMSTISDATVDDVSMRQHVGNQESGPGAAVVSSVVLMSSPTPFTLHPCSNISGGYRWPGQPGISGIIDWGATDYLIPSVNETPPYLYEEDTIQAYSPWITKPPTWTSTLPPTGTNSEWISNPDTTSQPYEPTDWFYNAGSGSYSYLSPGIDSAALVDALSNKRYFGFGWCIQGNGNRDFIGAGGTDDAGGDLNPGSMTVYYHVGSRKVGTFSSN